MKGEQWGEIEGYNGAYHVSNLGRIKSVERVVEFYRNEKLISIPIAERILKQRHLVTHNKLTNTQCEILTVMFRIPDSGKRYSTVVCRVVFQAFVGEIDFTDNKLIIYHKDEDALNNRAQNLITISRSDRSKKSYQQGRQPQVNLLNQYITTEIRRKATSWKFQAVTQYTIEGEVVKIFESMQEASRNTGLYTANIRAVIQGKKITAGGFLWAKGRGELINTNEAQTLLHKHKLRNCKAISQYDLAGNYLCTFMSLADAAKAINGHRSHIRNAMNGLCKTAYNFIWKIGSEKFEGR